MYFLKIPEYAIGSYFEELLEGRHNNEKNEYLITRLLSIKTTLVDAEAVYQSLALEKLLYTITEQETISIPPDVQLSGTVPRIITTEEMEKVYTSFFVDKPGSQKIGRKVYGSILSNTYYNLCPYCSHREVKTVDHYLPKTKFLSYAITPINLLPCCSDCNKDKLDVYILEDDKMLIHPYFDDIGVITWLKCKVVDNLWPITFSYEVSDITDPVLKSRIEYQFKLLKLGKLYADNATREFNKRAKSLVRVYNSNPSSKALDFINDNFESYHSENPNSWQTKMFEALKSSTWFIENALPSVQSYYQK
ncbi:hypothetical protein QFZ81_002983 [Paenibacillus sp. V4I9]|uniref:HNH endonuclease signature motif containing protein n=1 Tax=Paenibacillus sp. V4I9 TaxID=3042308 RepID=UPI0027861459|nr:HNH endonuclease signature motif containing protein [Paenibacillus sp. V4I9]MDQ0887895.1 hypothetical protein [Paenibacillus sp. V4I9]